jgi:hypothetical protein
VYIHCHDQVEHAVSSSTIMLNTKQFTARQGLQGNTQHAVDEHVQDIPTAGDIKLNTKQLAARQRLHADQQGTASTYAVS